MTIRRAGHLLFVTCEEYNVLIPSSSLSFWMLLAIIFLNHNLCANPSLKGNYSSYSPEMVLYVGSSLEKIDTCSIVKFSFPFSEFWLSSLLLVLWLSSSPLFCFPMHWLFSEEEAMEDSPSRLLSLFSLSSLGWDSHNGYFISLKVTFLQVKTMPAYATFQGHGIVLGNITVCSYLAWEMCSNWCSRWLQMVSVTIW